MVIFLDANVLIRYVTEPESSDGQRLATAAKALLDKIRNREIEATLSELVIHEVAYVLTSRRHYALSVDQTVAILRGILTFPGITLTRVERRTMLRAVELWESNPVLEFSDSLYAAKCQEHPWQLATFDAHFRRVDLDLYKF